uniref:PH domain-containing protein n=1 Tax=Chromera velia CCMP2878 TaxID=1169474 RepID=A0A0G4GDM5_9ALVE|eukprot:Cvel_21420.t1-p1 / transcript=Cvel_21420.t1 / gene=Cvel_21420 / organism=Chromera_velia_CCMP2878 / gene_product=hypothetical protein / transcript_product=hypothetical protein / location=Cvel_scaffold2007:19309-21471(+) / protein_length=371 / sequence_SO=supercontig / SO=protein_coding / is_pseudo=false
MRGLESGLAGNVKWRNDTRGAFSYLITNCIGACFGRRRPFKDGYFEIKGRSLVRVCGESTKTWPLKNVATDGPHRSDVLSINIVNDLYHLFGRASYTLRFNSQEEADRWREAIGGVSKVSDTDFKSSDTGVKKDMEAQSGHTGEGESTECSSSCRSSSLADLNSSLNSVRLSSFCPGVLVKEPPSAHTSPDYSCRSLERPRNASSLCSTILSGSRMIAWLVSVAHSDGVCLKKGKDVVCIKVKPYQITRWRVKAILRVGDGKTKATFHDGLGIASGLPGEQRSLLCVEKVFKSCTVPSHIKSAGLIGKTMHQDMLGSSVTMEACRLRQLRAAGLPCPKVYGPSSPFSLCMEFLGEGVDSPSPNLASNSYCL